MMQVTYQGHKLYTTLHNQIEVVLVVVVAVQVVQVVAVAETVVQLAHLLLQIVVVWVVPVDQVLSSYLTQHHN
tara:strand:+ start:438 stop:656 length:219 start_codon:yes stop_codon:yes gene_type:complete